MVNRQESLETLRDKIASLISNLETRETLHTVREALGLPEEEDSSSLGKYKYLRKVTSAASPTLITQTAMQILNAYPGQREKPSDADCQEIQDALWWIESNGVQEISNTLRYRLVEQLDGIRFWGRFSLADFLAKVLPAVLSNVGNLPKTGGDGYLYSRKETFWVDLQNLKFNATSRAESLSATKISLLDWLCGCGLSEWPDQRFCLLIEYMVHPEVQPDQIQQQLVRQINSILQQEGFELRQEAIQGGLPVYKVRKQGPRVSGNPKYIIFASVNEKPDIVIQDAINMDIYVVNQSDCLIYDQAFSDDTLSWQILVDWWVKSTKFTGTGEEQRKALGERLKASLQSDAERFLFSTYFRAFRSKYESALPALLPQVHLHYDPRSQRQRRQPILARQRMDFLMLLSHGTRVVIEIDGQHHYADAAGQASSQLYGNMVAEDRRIRLLNYEVYRFGGAELVEWNGIKFVPCSDAEEKVVGFFEALFLKHNIHPQPAPDEA